MAFALHAFADVDCAQRSTPKEATMLTLWIAAATLAAQATATTPQHKPSSKPPEKITITGCVERADQMAGAGASTLGTTVDSMSFVLVNIPPSGTAGTSGTAGAAKDSRPDRDAARLDP